MQPVPSFCSSPAAATHNSTNDAYSLDSLLNTVPISCPAINLFEEVRRRFKATQPRNELLTFLAWSILPPVLLLKQPIAYFYCTIFETFLVKKAPTQLLI